MPKPSNIWWGPPRKFSIRSEERKISWLELFYDLVYVIVIARLTHHLATNPGWTGILDYAYLFAMTFWGWYNGSQYYDLHGSPGIRTRFMTLWQMMAVAALAATMESPEDTLIARATISLLVLQGFITYLWWSVGIYDKQHRKLNVPYSICYVLAFTLMAVTFYIPPPFKRMVFWLALILNYFPAFLMATRLRARGIDFTLSTSMVERLGLFTIIVFGEAMLGVINGVQMHTIDAHQWICFGLGILIVFGLWWIFFSLIADRGSKKGMATGSVISLLYIPALASLGMVGAVFPGLLNNPESVAGYDAQASRIIYGASIAMFLCSITFISRFLIYPPEYDGAKRLLQPLLVVDGIVNVLVVVLFPAMELVPYLLCVFSCLLVIIIIITRRWFRVELRRLGE